MGRVMHLGCHCFLLIGRLLFMLSATRRYKRRRYIFHYFTIFDCNFLSTSCLLLPYFLLTSASLQNESKCWISHWIHRILERNPGEMLLNISIPPGTSCSVASGNSSINTQLSQIRFQQDSFHCPFDRQEMFEKWLLNPHFSVYFALSLLFCFSILSLKEDQQGQSATLAGIKIPGFSFQPSSLLISNYFMYPCNLISCPSLWSYFTV